MCGVMAAVGPRAAEQVSRGIDKMRHRGIRSKIVDFESSSIGHVRLPIVGVGEGYDQPISRGTWTIGFVGEILDFRERDPLAECDVDLVADTWDLLGPSGFTDFDGFWSVVAHDVTDGSVHAMVDYLSQKPLYVRCDEYARAVASEPDAVACLGPTEYDKIYLSSVVKWGYCPETWRTPYMGIRRMLPGEHAKISQINPVEYRRTDVLRTRTGSIDGLKSEIEAAVRRRVLSSDVPVACLVSGGLDSAITYTLASRYRGIRAYHVENGESEACRRVAPSATVLGLSGVSLEHALFYHQEPIDLGSLIPQVALSDAIAANGGERVCLTGDGADELFGGYSRAMRYDSQGSDVWHELVAWHLPRLDRVMMRNQIEVRSPFLARRVAEIALGLPRDARTNKKILRDAFRGELPPGVADLEKRALRTAAVADDRESRSRELVRIFTKE